MSILEFIDYVKNSRFAIICVTRKCNCRCSFCDVWSKEGTIDVKKYVNVAIPALRKAGFGLIEFTGGEPTVLRDLPYMIKETRKKGMFVQVMSNGTLMNEEMASKLKESGLNLLNISVDHYDNEIASKYRNYKDINGRIKNTVELAKKFRIGASSTTLLTKLNINEIEKVIEFVNNDLGILFSFCPPDSGGNYPLGSKEEKINPSKEELLGAFKTILKMKKNGYYIANTKAYINDSIRWLDGKSRYKCKGGKDIIYMDWDMNVFPCFIKEKLCSIDDFDKALLEDTKCDKCFFQCFREPSIYYSKLGKLDFFRDIRTLTSMAKDTNMTEKIS